MKFLIDNKKLVDSLISLDINRRNYKLIVEFSGYSNYTNPKEELSISQKEYQRLYDKYQLSGKREVLEHSVTLERSYYGYRKTLVITRADRNYYHQEILHYIQSSSDYPRRVLIVEKILINIEQPQDSVITEEISYTFPLRDNINLVLTRVLSDEDEVIYRAQLELTITDKVHLSLLESVSKGISSIIYKSIYSYTLSEYQSIVKLFNSFNKKGDQNNMIFDTRLVETPRNLKKEDLIRGGIIENNETTYWITHKIDGKRSFLIIYNKIVWLVEPKFNGVRKITHTVPVSISNIFNKMEGIIIDGTIVKSEDLRLNGKGENENPYNATEIFYVYDILSNNRELPYIVEGTSDITKFTSKQRYNTSLIKNIGILFQAIFRKKVGYRLGVTMVDVIALNKHRNRDSDGRPMDTFSLAIYEMLNRQKEKVYPSSGLIFRPGLKPYGRITAQIKDRVLTKTMESCKWERLHNMKIHLRVRKRDDIYALFSSTFDGEEEFFGTHAYPFNPESMLDYDHPLLNLDISNKIAEFRWDQENKKLYPFKIHYDRKYANSSMVALDSWILMIDPIREKTLLGQDNTFFVYQQERLRKKLYKKAASDVLNPHLLDLSARAFNVLSWKDYGRTIALVTSNTIELVKEEVIDVYQEIPLVLNVFNAQKITRAKIDKKRVILLNVLITDTTTILQTISEYLDDKVDVIAAMYSIEFWLNTQDRKLAIKTISEALIPGGTFIYLVFNSVNLEKIIDTQMDTLLLDNKPFYYDRDNLIEFNLDVIPEIERYYGTNRKKNTEPVVVPKINLDTLILDLVDKDFDLEINLRSDGDRLLHFTSYLISSLFNFGLFRKSNIIEREILPPVRDLKKAYVLLLMKGNSYLPGILTTANSLKLTGSNIDRVCMVTPDINKKTVDIIKKSGLFTKIVKIEYLRSATMEMTVRNKELYGWMTESYTKWQCLKMTEYDRVFFLDADLLILKNIDHLFDLNVPAATFSYTRTRSLPDGTDSRDLNAEFPHLHGDKIDPELILNKIKIGTTFTASLVILKPDLVMYNDMLELLEIMKTDPNEIIYKEIPRVKYGFENEDEEKEYTIVDMAGTDERSLAYLYSTKGYQWYNIHPRFNLVANRPDWIVKPGTDTGLTSRYYTPSILHYIQKIKPWSSDRLVNKQDYITTRLWYYIFTELLNSKHIKVDSIEGLITKKRYDEIKAILGSKRSVRSYFRYRYIPKLHRYVFPWVNNIDFDPWGLKWKPGERPKLEKEWEFDPNTVFIINSTKFPDQYQKGPGRGMNEILPDVRIPEFKELSIISNWRYLLYLIVNNKNGIPSTELEQRTLMLTSDSVLANYRNSNTGHFGIDGGMWALMNYRHRLLIGKIPKIKPVVRSKKPVVRKRIIKRRIVRKR